MKHKYNVTISIEDNRDLHFYGVTLQMFYALREKYFRLYGNRVQSIETHLASRPEKRVDALCYYPEEDEEYNNPTKFYERYGW